MSSERRPFFRIKKRALRIGFRGEGSSDLPALLRIPPAPLRGYEKPFSPFELFGEDAKILMAPDALHR